MGRRRMMALSFDWSFLDQAGATGASSVVGTSREKSKPLDGEGSR